jgi:hypothetical protein
VFTNFEKMFLKGNLGFFKNKEKHQFHLVESSLLPVVTGFSAMLVVMSLVFY